VNLLTPGTDRLKRGDRRDPWDDPDDSAQLCIRAEADEHLQRPRAEKKLAELTNPGVVAAEAAAEPAARAALDEAEAQTTQARMMWQFERGVVRDRQERVKTRQAEVPRAEAAIRSAQSLREKAQGSATSWSGSKGERCGRARSPRTRLESR
jgi:hypothetical protein